MKSILFSKATIYVATAAFASGAVFAFWVSGSIASRIEIQKLRAKNEHIQKLYTDASLRATIRNDQLENMKNKVETYEQEISSRPECALDDFDLERLRDLTARPAR